MCLSCDGQGKKIISSKTVNGIMTPIYGEEDCVCCRGTGEDKSISIDELDENPIQEDK